MTDRSRELPLALLAVASALAFVAAGRWLSRDAAPTYDEVAHVAAAYEYTARGRYQLNRAHPPLSKQLAGLALRSLELDHRPPAAPPPATEDEALHWFQEQWRSGRHLLLAQELDPLSIINRARLPLVLLGVPLVLATALWARVVGGRVAAATAAVLTAASPNLLAHGRLVHNDFALTVWTALAFAGLALWARRPSWRRALPVASAVGLALATKYAALLLGPALVTVAVGSLLAARRGPGGPSLRDWVRLGAVVVACSALSVALCTGAFDPTWWSEGLQLFLGDSRTGYEVYCAGSYSADGFWYYFPLLLLTKLPLPVLLLAACALPALRRSGPERRRAVVFAALPALVLLGLTMALAFPIGLRYLLPMLPAVLVLAGAGGAWLWRRHPAGRVALVALLALHASGPFRSRADPLAFFNLAAGGPRAGYRWFDDSNVDWGQSLPALAAWYRQRTAAQPGARLAVGHFGSIPAELWPGADLPRPDIALTWRLLLPDFDALALSPHLLARETERARRLTDAPLGWADPAWPSDRIRDTYLVYDITVDGDAVRIGGSPPMPRDAWLEAARRRFGDARRALRASAAAAESVQLHGQAARFFARWAPDGPDVHGARQALDGLLGELAAAGIPVPVPPALRAEMRAYWLGRGAPQRAARYE